MEKINQFLLVFIFCNIWFVSNAKPSIELDKIEYDIISWSQVISIERNGQHNCMGTYIRDRTILTATKCIENIQNANELSVQLNSIKWKKAANYEVTHFTVVNKYLTLLFVNKPIEELNPNSLVIESHTKYYSGDMIYWKKSNDSNYYKSYEERAWIGCYDGPYTQTDRDQFCTKSFGVNSCVGQLGSPLLKRIEQDGKGILKLLGVLYDQPSCTRSQAYNIFVDLEFYKKTLENSINANVYGGAEEKFEKEPEEKIEIEEEKVGEDNKLESEDKIETEEKKVEEEKKWEPEEKFEIEEEKVEEVDNFVPEENKNTQEDVDDFEFTLPEEDWNNFEDIEIGNTNGDDAYDEEYLDKKK